MWQRKGQPKGVPEAPLLAPKSLGKRFPNRTERLCEDFSASPAVLLRTASNRTCPSAKCSRRVVATPTRKQAGPGHDSGNACANANAMESERRRCCGGQLRFALPGRKLGMATHIGTGMGPETRCRRKGFLIAFRGIASGIEQGRNGVRQDIGPTARTQGPRVRGRALVPRLRQAPQRRRQVAISCARRPISLLVLQGHPWEQFGLLARCVRTSRKMSFVPATPNIWPNFLERNR